MLSTLKRLKARRENDEGGFTLIELLIVIVVLGILAAVVVFSLGGVTQKADVSACQADGATLSTAIAAFDNLNPGVTATLSSRRGHAYPDVPHGHQVGLGKESRARQFLPPPQSSRTSRARLHAHRIAHHDRGDRHLGRCDNGRRWRCHESRQFRRVPSRRLNDLDGTHCIQFGQSSHYGVYI